MAECMLSLSYGKDSLACLGAIEALGWPLDRITHAEVWATDTIPGDLPPMVEFKARADAIIRERWGIEVEHVCALAKDGTKQTYERLFYHPPMRKGGKFAQGTPAGWPYQKGAWCNDRLKTNVLDSVGGADTIKYLGVAADEPERIKRHTRSGVALPLVAVGWTEADCWRWCADNGLLSPIYTTAARGGCWFCHNQGVDQLRLLRRNYPEYWALMLRWDADSPVTFKPSGHTIRDFDRRFALEDEGLLDPCDRCFRWSMLEESYLNYRIF